MKIDQTIRKYRKEQNLTQEQLASYLGVTAPAVNKWENGVSYPDITLLNPLARILKINVDILLSFHEDLTNIEIEQIIRETSETLNKEGYQTAFDKANAFTMEYPNCNKLIYSLTTLLYAQLQLHTIKDKNQYMRKIEEWFELIASGTEKTLADLALVSLCRIQMDKKEYEKAQQILDRIPPTGFDKRITQAQLYERIEKNQEAFKLYEQLLYKASNDTYGILNAIISLLCKEQDFDTAKQYAELSMTLSELFDLGAYVAYTPKLMIALKKQDAKESIELLEQMVKGINEIGEIRHSKLYKNLMFSDENNVNAVKQMIKQALLIDKELDFIKNEPGYKRILNQLESE